MLRISTIRGYIFLEVKPSCHRGYRELCGRYSSYFFIVRVYIRLTHDLIVIKVVTHVINCVYRL